MKKFKKRTLPELSTSSLPDIVFMLLFFFMVTTVVRHDKSKLSIVKPEAQFLDKLDQPSLTSTLIVGLDNIKNIPVFEFDGVSMSPEAALKLIVADRLALPENQQPAHITVIKADRNVPMEEINRLKELMKEYQLFKISYAANQP